MEKNPTVMVHTHPAAAEEPAEVRTQLDPTRSRLEQNQDKLRTNPPYRISQRQEDI